MSQNVKTREKTKKYCVFFLNQNLVWRAFFCAHHAGKSEERVRLSHERSWVCHECIISVSWACHECVMSVSWALMSAHETMYQERSWDICLIPSLFQCLMSAHETFGPVSAHETCPMRHIVSWDVRVRVGFRVGLGLGGRFSFWKCCFSVALIFLSYYLLPPKSAPCRVTLLPDVTDGAVILNQIWRVVLSEATDFLFPSLISVRPQYKSTRGSQPYDQHDNT